MRSVRINPLVRAGLVFGALAAVTTGVTFAALQAQATMTESTITTSSVGLKVWDGDSYELTGPGFTVNNFIPGTGSIEKPFYFKNDGGAALDLVARGTNFPTTTGFNGLDNVKITITGEKCNQAITTTLNDVINFGVTLPCNPLAVGATGNPAVPGTAGNYKAKFDLNPDAVFGTSASVSAFNITYTGTQVVAAE